MDEEDEIAETARQMAAQQASVTNLDEARKKKAKKANGHAEPAEERLPPPVVAELPADAPFQPLGFYGRRYYFLPHSGQQVLAFSARELGNPSELFSLARLEWWQEHFPPEGRTARFSISAASDCLQAACHQRGIYDHGRARGRGVWLDEGKVVVHLGDRLMLDGGDRRLNEHAGRWVYEQRAALAIDAGAKPLGAEDATGLVRLCAAISFTNPDRDSILFAGWLAAALIAGALPWRPHCWLNSEIGEGKTWLMEHIALPVLGPLAVYVASKSTEPGIRRVMQVDALAFLYDEAEGNTPETASRVAGILELMRQASSESQAGIVQAVSGGSHEVASYRPRFMGLLGSVSLSLTEAADQSRFLVMPLRQSTAEEFAELLAREAVILTPGYGERLFARMLGLVPVVRANHAILSRAIAKHGNKRAGDTLGVCIAGWQALKHDRVLSEQEADDLVRSLPWLAEAAAAQVPLKEWQSFFGWLGQQRLRVGHGPTAQDVTVFEAVAWLSGYGAIRENGPLAQDVERALGMAGIRCGSLPDRPQDRGVEFAPSSAKIGGWLDRERRTGWKQWREVVERAPGAYRQKPKHFPGLTTMRCVGVPVSTFLGLPDPTSEDIA